MSSLVKTIYEFLVWDNCHNRCKFCFQRNNPRNFDISIQEHICDNVIQYLNSEQYTDGNHVLIVGGELFDDVNRSFLSKFFDQLTDMMVSNKIDLLYINTNLIFNQQCLDNLKNILDIFVSKKVISRLKFTTSYDLNGRFKTEKSKELFLQNLNELSKTEGLNIVTNIILTKDICVNNFDIFQFEKETNTSVNLIPYIILDKSLAATRKEIFSYLQWLASMSHGFISKLLFELDLKQPRRLLVSQKDGWIEKTCDNSECGHSVNFKRYSDSGHCFVCDVKELFNRF